MQLSMGGIPTWFAAFQVESYIACFFSIAADENDDTVYMKFKCVTHKVHRTPQNHCTADFCALCLTEGLVKRRQDPKWLENEAICVIADQELDIASWKEVQAGRELPFWALMIYVCPISFGNFFILFPVCMWHPQFVTSTWQRHPNAELLTNAEGYRVLTHSRPLVLRFCYCTSCSPFASAAFYLTFPNFLKFIAQIWSWISKMSTDKHKQLLGDKLMQAETGSQFDFSCLFL